MVKIFKALLVLLILNLVIFLAPVKLFAEYKSDIPSGQNIPKLQATPDDPKLINGHVYPNWGPICQRYTYSVIYSDDKGRSPEYVKIYFNGEMIDMEKENSEEVDYLKGVKYVYQYVPNKLGSNFFFFEASNGLGKARSNIIDSPDNGPVLFKSAFDKNEIAVIDVSKQTKILSYDTEDEWVGGIALSDDGRYLAAKTHKKVYFFDTSKPEEPLWTYNGMGESPGDVKGGVDISGDGRRIIASIGGQAILFDSESNKPLWIYKGSGNQAYNVAISKDGKYMAMGTAGGVSSTVSGYQSSETTNLLIFWNEKSEVPLWQYHTEGNFHDVSLSDDGSFITGATGCPDRRFYLFSKESNKPIIRSEMLTRDSPVHRAKISGDGQYAAVGSESNDGAVYLFSKDSNEPVWKYPMPDRSSVRALNFTSDGAYIGAATFKGDIFIFGRETNTPVSHWKVNASLGGIDIAEDGSFVATGGTDNNLYIFMKGRSEPYSVGFNEYVEEVDISADGKYVAAGTGGSVYFFEAFDDDTQILKCKEIIEPPAENAFNKGDSVRENDFSDLAVKKRWWPGMLFGFGFLGFLGFMVGYMVVSKFNLVAKFKGKKNGELLGNVGVENRQKEQGFNLKIIIVTGVVSLVFLVLTIISMVVNSRDNQALKEDGGLIQREGRGIQQGECGNGLCEPDFGETKASCSQDCSGDD